MTLPTLNSPIEILLVEDSPTDAMMAREALAYNKVLNKLHIVKDGVEAMAFLRRQGKYAQALRPGLVLLDLNLPKKSGIEVLAEVKTDETLKAIPIVILTTSQAEEDIVRSYGHHANCYITKPVEFPKLVEALRSLNEFWFSVVTLPPEML